MENSPTLMDRVEMEELPARVVSLRELAAIINETVHQLRAAHRLVLCAARQIEKERRVSVALGEAQLESRAREPDPSNDPLLSINEVAKLLGVDRSTLYLWDRKGHFVRPIQLSQARKKYLKRDVDEWLRSKRKA